MTIDYSKITPRICRCSSIKERDFMVTQLKEWGVPIYLTVPMAQKETDWCYIAWEYIGEEQSIEICRNKSSFGIIDSSAGFLSEFKEVYDEFHKKEIIFPDREEVAKQIEFWYSPDDGVETIGNIIRWYKEQVIKLNK